MRFFEINRCSAAFICSSILCAGIALPLNAQEPQTQRDTRPDGERGSDVDLFAQFLDAHTNMDAQLRHNPSLLTNAEYLHGHPELENFLNQHPQVQSKVRENPSFFEDRKRRFDQEAVRRAQQPQAQTDTAQNSTIIRDTDTADANRMDRDNTVTAAPIRQDNEDRLITLDQFLDKYPDIERDLQRDPALADDSKYLRGHPPLLAYLGHHSNARREIAQSPRLSTPPADRIDAQEQQDRSNPAVNRADENPDRENASREDANRADDNRDDARPDDSNRQDTNTEGVSRDNADRENANSKEAMPDARRTMNDFLHQSPTIERELWRNPSLVNNTRYVHSRPELESFLNQHPEVQEQIQQDPRYLMQSDKGGQGEADSRNQAGSDVDARGDINHGRDAAMDEFLQKYPTIERQLWRNPSLINDQRYLQSHPQLQAFLDQHPQVRQDIQQNPRYFSERRNGADNLQSSGFNRDVDSYPDRNAQVQSEQDTDRRETAERRDPDDLPRETRNGRVDRRPNANPMATDSDTASIKDFLSRQQNIDWSLAKKPKLINDYAYLRRHPDLNEFLEEHPAVRDRVRQDPSYFRYEDGNEVRNDNVPTDSDRTNRYDRELTVELQDFDRFLDKHRNIKKDLQTNPSFANDRHYLKHNQALKSFLAKNPRVRDGFRQDPSGFMDRAAQLEARGHRMN
jgi:phage-related protein